ncbi:hypothetical protein A5662_26315 [Mycobacteriaceae bacterium 1482268.1]|nr:hypothetical protein A5662_26315 [Mycobacteriaceae bacterium 1482268.1]
MKLMAVLALACGVTAAPMMAAGTASADRGVCDGVDCVPFVDRNIVPTDHCSFGSRYVYGLDATGNTFACAATNEWLPVSPLIGVRTLRAPCDPNVPASAQSPAGQPLKCAAEGFTSDFDSLYYAGS